MPTITAASDKSMEKSTVSARAVLQSFFEARHHLRKGICLLNAGDFERAAAELAIAARHNQHGDDLPAYLVAALAGCGRYDEAADELDRRAGEGRDDLTNVIRLALAQWKAGRGAEGVRTLREAVADHPHNAELHFQLGTLLAAQDAYEEAELRFNQAVAIDREHHEALVSLALSHAARQDLGAALKYLQRAQELRPDDARTCWLLASMARTAYAVGQHPVVRARMPDNVLIHSETALEELSRLLEAEPDFADAFLALTPVEVHEEVFGVLTETIRRAIARNPRQAQLHYQCGRVLARLGRSEEAIASTEEAVQIDPHHVSALIQLARLYQQTNRLDDATTRLEETVRLGAEYADTYYLLGNLYRDTGKIERARWAYENALRINARFDAARQALETLAA